VRELCTLDEFTAEKFLTQELVQQMRDAGAGAHLKASVAFPHPITRCPVFCVPDFPHAAKKVMNGLHNPGRNVSRVVGEKEEVVSLKLLEDVWKFNCSCARRSDPSGPQAAPGEIALSTDKLLPEYFRQTP